MIRALALVLLAAPATAETLRIGTEAGFAPYIMATGSGELMGFDKDMGDEICARLRADCEWVTVQWDGIIDGLLVGDYDMIIGGMAASAARAQRVDFSRGYLGGGAGASAFVGLRDDIDPSGARIAVQAATVYSEHLIGSGNDVMLVRTGQDALDAVRSGAATLAFGSPTYLERMLLTTYRDLRVVSTIDMPVDPTAIAFRPDDDALRARVDLVLTGMLSDGTINDIAAVWFPARDDT
ncbi:transporter substrate-binding domain-containing protein [Octadecabacter sp. SW4]|uniref:transporter substrate-binding domain-containing protein n=1 Tax=Octadecabacter sp. SW4 TaxID=2602067 RepID=UPI0011C1E183|nr:transporter substrate-binding domain-containing protein [Octadecabacter sp. SW4]QEE35107.1 transporter substrate-binding domain-containing protein [Octadecabacter sp. SW4]